MPVPVSRVLALDLPEGIDLGQAARYMGAKDGGDEKLRALLERWAPPLRAVAAPRAVWLRAPVGALGDLWQGSDIRRHLAGCTEAVLLAVTLGPGADAQIRRAGVGDVAAGAASDALASVLAEQAAEAAEARLRALAAAEGMYLTGRYSPGYGGLAHRGAAPDRRAAGHAAADRPVRHRHLPDAAPQEHHGGAGAEPDPRHRAPGRLRPLRFAGQVRIPKERRDL